MKSSNKSNMNKSTSSYENLLFGNDICFNYPLDLKLQSPIVYTRASPTVKDKSNENVSNI